MRKMRIFLLVAVTCCTAAGQNRGPDERYKSDILLVVAHPDDDTVVASYLARAIFDQHKRVAVVYCTRGDSGGNAIAREHAHALGVAREIEGRRALSTLGIENVWFLDGRDTASQNVLVSLGSWPHGAVLEQLVRIMRLTRPEVVFTWLPSSVAGENHGDHQAAGVIATEAFDLAGSDTAFPSQLAAPVRSLENALDGLSPWQPRKLYFFTDAFKDDFFREKGPAYAISEISPLKKISYLQLAIEEFAPYYTQSPEPKLNQQVEKKQNMEAILKMLTSGEQPYFSDPLRLFLGKSLVKTNSVADVFDGIGTAVKPEARERGEPGGGGEPGGMRLGGAFGFYRSFWEAHHLESLQFLEAEIAVAPGDTLSLPVVVENHSPRSREFIVELNLPAGWTQKDKALRWTIGPGEEMPVSIPVTAPADESKSFQAIEARASVDGKAAGAVKLWVQVRRGVFPQLR